MLADLVAEPWHDEEHRYWRWVPWFAWRPTRTFDAGWIWLKFYWRWQSSWGWGFWDDYAYRTKEGRDKSFADIDRRPGRDGGLGDVRMGSDFEKGYADGS